MRSSKYHDYRVLKVILFIVLVVLGLFIYVKCIKAPLEHEHTVSDTWSVETEATCTTDGLKVKICTECNERVEEEVIPMLGHSEGEKVIEKVIPSTCTVGGSHDEVVYCDNCGCELSRDTVNDEVIDHNPGKAVKEKEVLPTHTVPGSYDMVVYCTECGAELSDHKDTKKGIVIPEKGHNYVWTTEYDEENDRILLIGVCNCDEEGNNVTLTGEDAGVTITRDTSYAPCCLNRYYVEYTYYGKVISKSIDLPLENHKLFIENVLDQDGGFVSVYEFASYDEEGAYFDYSKTIINSNVRIVASDVWGDDGFRIGYFRCMACEDVDCKECCPDGGYSWREVRLYFAEYDKSKSGNEEA